MVQLQGSIPCPVTVMTVITNRQKVEASKMVYNDWQDYPLPIHYTDKPTKARIFKSEILTDAPEPWELDGIDEAGNYSEETWSFKTWADALAAVPEFYQRVIKP